MYNPQNAQHLGMTCRVNTNTFVVHKSYITRLLGRPQPQMYPPVALNQYKWVNRTHKHFFIYASMPHANFEIDFTPKLSSQQHVKYGSNLIKICY